MVVILPILAFLFVFVVVYALLTKTKILGGNSFIHSLLSLVISLIFSMSPSATEITVLTTPWIAVLITTVFFILLIFAFVHGKIEDVVKSPIIGIILVIVILIIFIAAAINVFGPIFSQYMPGYQQKPGLISYITNPTVLGGLILLIIAAVTSWIFTKK